MNRRYNNRNNDDFEFNCGIDPFKIFIKGKHGDGAPFFRFGHGIDNLFRNRRGNSFFSNALVEKGEDAYTITIDIPGVSKEDIQLEITAEELWLKAKNEEFNKNYEEHLFFRDAIDPDKFNAQLKAGILRITAPFANVKPKKLVNIE
jgi:HSP20 family protein